MPHCCYINLIIIIDQNLIASRLVWPVDHVLEQNEIDAHAPQILLYHVESASNDQPQCIFRHMYLGNGKSYDHNSCTIR